MNAFIQYKKNDQKYQTPTIHVYAEKEYHNAILENSGTLLRNINECVNNFVSTEQNIL